MRSAPTLGLFVPCYVDELWPQAAKAAVQLIEAFGFRVQIADPVCCGQVLSNAGAEEDAQVVQGIWKDGHADFEEVVILSASCCSYLYKSGHAAPVLREFCDWVSEHAPAEFPNPVSRKVAYHKSCSAQRGTHTVRHARDVLRRVRGLELVEPVGQIDCCGFGGSFASNFPELSVRMGQDHMNCLLEPEPGVQGLVSADCSCMIHLKGISDPTLRFWHVAELLWGAMK